MGLIRFFLAAVVAQGHLRQYLNQFSWQTGSGDLYVAGMNAGYAVMFFYVISGFLISLALNYKYAGANGTRQFYRNRFVRIFSFYWPMLLFAEIFWPTTRAATDYLATIANVTLLGSDWYVAFAHYPEQVFSFNRVLTPAWTLGAELTFYAIAPWILRSTPVSLILLLLSLAIRLSFHKTFGWSAGGDVWLYHFFPSTLCFFLLGHFARLGYDRLQKRIPWELGVIVLGVSVYGAVRSISTGGFDSPYFYLAVGSFVISLPVIFDHTKDIVWMNHFGEASYPMYLVHLALLVTITGAIGATDTGLLKGFMTSLFGGFGTEVTCLLFIIVVGAIGYLCHRIIERPVARGMNYAIDLLSAVRNRRRPSI